MVAYPELERRIKINQLALLHVDGVRGVYPCTVVDFWGDGAMLHSRSYHTAAFEFDLSFDGFKTTKRCHVVWRAGNMCGVEFVDRSEACRRVTEASNDYS